MTPTKRLTIANSLLIVGLLALLVMAAMPLLGVHAEWTHWVYAAGAVLVLVARILEQPSEGSLRLRRLYRLLVVSALLYCASAAVVFWYRGTSNWLAFLLAGAVMQLYASTMIAKVKR